MYSICSVYIILSNPRKSICDSQPGVVCRRTHTNTIYVYYAQYALVFYRLSGHWFSQLSVWCRTSRIPNHTAVVFIWEFVARQLADLVVQSMKSQKRNWLSKTIVCLCPGFYFSFCGVELESHFCLLVSFVYYCLVQQKIYRMFRSETDKLR
jgi:hypothetical protein